jgi:hypothetical protein
MRVMKWHGCGRGADAGADGVIGYALRVATNLQCDARRRREIPFGAHEPESVVAGSSRECLSGCVIPEAVRHIFRGSLEVRVLDCLERGQSPHVLATEGMPRRELDRVMARMARKLCGD